MEVKDIAATQKRALRDFDRVSEVCRGMASALWIAGPKIVFDTDVRYPRSKRPFILALEVSDSLGLTLTLAVLCYKDGWPLLDVIGRWDFRAPISPTGYGPQMNSRKWKHNLNASKGCELLQALVEWGHNPTLPEAAIWPRFLVPFQAGEETYDDIKVRALVAAEPLAGLEDMQAAAIQADMTEQHGPMVYVDASVAIDDDIRQAIEQNKLVENYRPILGFADRNPLSSVKTIKVRRQNPAFNILRRRGIKNIDDVTADGALVNELVAEMRLSFTAAEMSDDDVFTALLHAKKPVHVHIPVDAAIKEAPKHAANVLRTSASKRAQREATDGELLAAALTPDKPLMLSRLSAIQITTASQFQVLPNWLNGSIFADANWTPKIKIGGVMEDAKAVCTEAATT